MKTIAFHLFCDPSGYAEDERLWHRISEGVIETYNDKRKDKDKVKYKFSSADLPQDMMQPEKYDILLFDWGGMSGGNSMMEHFSNLFVNLAKDNPNKYFVVVSSFTSWAVKDAIDDIGNPELPNLFLDGNEFFRQIREDKILL